MISMPDSLGALRSDREPMLELAHLQLERLQTADRNAVRLSSNLDAQIAKVEGAGLTLTLRELRRMKENLRTNRELLAKQIDRLRSTLALLAQAHLGDSPRSPSRPETPAE